MGKLCPKCRNYKLLAEFSASSKTRDGKQGWCKTCMQEALRKWKQKRKKAWSRTSGVHYKTVLKEHSWKDCFTFLLTLHIYATEAQSMGIKPNVSKFMSAYSRCKGCGDIRDIGKEGLPYYEQRSDQKTLRSS